MKYLNNSVFLVFFVFSFFCLKPHWDLPNWEARDMACEISDLGAGKGDFCMTSVVLIGILCFGVFGLVGNLFFNLFLAHLQGISRCFRSLAEIWEPASQNQSQSEIREHKIEDSIVELINCWWGEDLNVYWSRRCNLLRQIWLIIFKIGHTMIDHSFNILSVISKSCA